MFSHAQYNADRTEQREKNEILQQGHILTSEVLTHSIYRAESWNNITCSHSLDIQGHQSISNRYIVTTNCKSNNLEKENKTLTIEVKINSLDKSVQVLNIKLNN